VVAGKRTRIENQHNFFKKNELSKDAIRGILGQFISNVLKVLVEAGGIEPPSEDIQRRTSTCLASILNLVNPHS
jgi:hypothetical protein